MCIYKKSFEDIPSKHLTREISLITIRGKFVKYLHVFIISTVQISYCKDKTM